ncbi:MAG TPA: hypothetical protein VK524_06540, partial [Polyangiaceae bacterium]|nr:hypothetical protein [Polyangiaceae bacterium]
MKSPDEFVRHADSSFGRAACALLAVLACACSSDDDSSSGTPGDRPAGPAADVSQEITGGNGPFIGAATGLTVPSGYVEREYVASGTATAYE